MNRELIERLEKAEAGSRELDAAIVAVLSSATVRPYPPSDDFGLSAKWQFWSLDGAHFLGNETRFPVEPVTTSLDAALALAERVISARGPIDMSIMGSAQVVILNADPCGNALAEAYGNTPALALCVAILKAATPNTEEKADA